MQFEFLGVLIRWHVGESGRAIRNSNTPKRFALQRKSNRYGGIGCKEQRGEFALGPPVRNGRSCGGAAQAVDFTRGREPLGGIGGREVRNGLSEGAGHGGVRNCSLRTARKEAEAT